MTNIIRKGILKGLGIADMQIHTDADFIKTSTGKENVNATLPFSLVMVRVNWSTA